MCKKYDPFGFGFYIEKERAHGAVGSLIRSPSGENLGTTGTPIYKLWEAFEGAYELLRDISDTDTNAQKVDQALL